jgi:ATP-dependent NAD(P)H-hydrate dehydratase
LKGGADLTRIFCNEAASIPIKSYSPENIVVPILNNHSNQTSIYETWLPLSNSIVIGPGLGRDEGFAKNLISILEVLDKYDDI